MNTNTLDDTKVFQFLEDEEKAIAWCQEVGLIKKTRICCGNVLTPIFRNTKKTKGFYFRCPRDLCRKEYSIRSSTFFENSKLKIGQIITLIFYFVNNETKFTNLKRKTKISSNKTLVDWLSFCREICVLHFLENPVKLGGVGRTVEIDETLFVKRKGLHGRLVREQWVFGGYDPVLKEGFLCPVVDRTRETLLPLIKEHIILGTTIISDEARVYCNLQQEGYIHQTVNHSIGQWVNQENGATTNHVEAYWGRAKDGNKARKGTHRTTLESHLADFMWKNKFGCDVNEFIRQIVLHYPN